MHAIDVRSRTLPAIAGCKIVTWHRGAGPPLLLIQGTGVHGDGWLPQVESLRADHDCLWFDNRGMGRSSPAGSAPISVQQMASDALAVMDHAGWDHAHIVGHSLGGCIALELALTYPQRVRSLSLLCTAADGPGLVRIDAAMIWRGLRMKIGTRAARRRAFLEVVLTPLQYDEGDLAKVAAELEPVFGHDLAIAPSIVMKQVRAMSRWSATDRLAQLCDTPTLVVGAEHDLIAKLDLVRALAAGIPGANLVELPDAAHGVTVMSPALINDLLRRHIAAVEARITGR